MRRITALLLPILLLCSCRDQGTHNGNDDITAQELSKLIGMHTFTANISLALGEELHIGTFEEAGQRQAFVRFPAADNLVDARMVIAYWKTDKSPEANYGYIVPSGDWGTGTLKVPQPYTGATWQKTPCRTGDGFAFLRFEGSDRYLGYWITPNKPDSGDGR